MIEWWLALHSIEQFMFYFAGVIVFIGILAHFTEIAYEASDKPYRYNPELTMVENGKAQKDRDKVLADRKIAASKRTQERKAMVIPRDVE